MGVSGTPTVFVNSVRVGGLRQVPSYQEIEQAVNAASGE
jgi:protein-disulfide isomerase